jgi:hypothetical protein
LSQAYRAPVNLLWSPARSTIELRWWRPLPVQAAALRHFVLAAPEHGGKEGLSEMMKKYPNWFSPHLHEFWGQAEKLPFDQHWLIALAAPRPFIALEGTSDQNVNQKRRQAIMAGGPVALRNVWSD